MTVPVFDSGGVRVFQGDCIEVMREMPAESVHAVVTDPPYGIAFMGKAWDQPGEFGSTRRGRTRSVPMNAGGIGDHKETTERSGAMIAGDYDMSSAALVNFQRWCESWARECFRLLKPGGHLLSFGGSRTWHRLASGIEDAGFEMRDSIAWLYGSGFPKSLDVSKAIDKAAGVAFTESPDEGVDFMRPDGRGGYNVTKNQLAREGESTAEAKAWEGWGTALKPSFEPIVVARKPLIGTVAANVLAHGTGALNIDATRIVTGELLAGGAYTERATVSDSLNPSGMNVVGAKAHGDFVQPSGRWPSNVVLDESQAAELDAQSGTLTSGANPEIRGGDTDSRQVYGGFTGGRNEQPRRGTDSGGASRFFPTFRYEAKAPQFERPRAGELAHPTVKPLDLMRWLVRLVTPPGGVVLEPFAGSGTTLEACVREGFEAVGIEREADYLPLIVKRLSKDHQQSLFGDWDGAA